MGIKGWYLTPDNTVSSNYTEFNPINDSFPVSSYTDFTAMQTYTPVRKRTVRKPSVKAIKTVKTGTQKKSHAGRKILCAFGVLAIVLTSVAGTWYYLNGNDDLKAAAVFEAGSKTKNKNTSSDTDKEDLAGGKVKDLSDKKHTKTNDGISYSKSSPAYTVAENIMSTLWCDNDVDTAREIFNWVHSNVYYQAMTSELSFEDAAYRGFTRKSGDCYVYFACAKMLLDCAGIPNMMVERYPVYTNDHYWNLVQLDGEWYHCDATVFKDHPEMYFMCTDEEIADEHHSFDSSRYPERASSSYYLDYPGNRPQRAFGSADGPYIGYYEDDEYSERYEDYGDDYYEDYSGDYYGDYEDGYSGDYDGYIDDYDDYSGDYDGYNGDIFGDYYDEDYSGIYVGEWE